jgi:hypothetical protein
MGNPELTAAKFDDPGTAFPIRFKAATWFAALDIAAELGRLTLFPLTLDS